MELLIKPEVVFYSLISLLLGIVVYFLKQLHKDFKKVEKDITEVKTTTALTRLEFKGNQDLMNQKIEFLEKRFNHFESNFIVKSKNGKEKHEAC